MLPIANVSKFIGYVEELLLEVEKNVKSSANFQSTNISAPLCHDFEHPLKKEAVIKHQSRFTSKSLVY